jgi:hypothetical protein
MRTLARATWNPDFVRIRKAGKFCTIFNEDAVMIGLKLRRYWVTARPGFIILILAIGKLCSLYVKLKKNLYMQS